MATLHRASSQLVVLAICYEVYGGGTLQKHRARASAWARQKRNKRYRHQVFFNNKREREPFALAVDDGVVGGMVGSETEKVGLAPARRVPVRL